MRVTRRDFARAEAGVAGIGLAPALHARQPIQAARIDPWDEARAILARIVPPSFPTRVFDITSFGARWPRPS